MTVMVTGHRVMIPPGYSGPKYPDQSQEVNQHHTRILNKVIKFIQDMYHTLGQNTYISGMAIGADQLFAEAVIHLKNNQYPINLVAAIPFQGQESNWPESGQLRYNQILAWATQAVYVSDPGYSPAKMQVRNEWMVNNSEIVLALWDGKQSGGTWNCLQYARQCGRTIYQLNPSTTDLPITIVQ